MNKKVIDSYLEKMPVEIRDAVIEINSEQKWAVYLALIFNKEMYFNEIKKHFDANPNTINPILKSLVASGLIAKRVRRLEDFNDDGKVYYQATNLGEKFLAAMYDIILPPLKEEKMTIKIQDDYLIVPLIEGSRDNIRDLIKGFPYKDVIKIDQGSSQRAEVYIDQSSRYSVKV
jgi:DNA-binding HxlR family transcriptional regulator